MQAVVSDDMKQFTEVASKFTDISGKFKDKFLGLFEKVAKKNEELEEELKKAKFEAKHELSESKLDQITIAGKNAQIAEMDEDMEIMKDEIKNLKQELSDERDMNKLLSKSLQSLRDGLASISSDIKSRGESSPARKLDQLAAAAVADKKEPKVKAPPKAKSPPKVKAPPKPKSVESSSVGEKRKREIKCSVCKEIGHNKRGCEQSKAKKSKKDESDEETDSDISDEESSEDSE